MERPLDLKSGLRAIVRYRFLVVALGVLGLVLGWAYTATHPAQRTAVALVLLPPAATDANGNSTRDIGTQIAIAKSSAVLSNAGKSLTPPIDSMTLSHALKISSVSEEILAFRAHASSGAVAEKMANSAAAAYVAYVTTASTTSNDGIIAELRQQSIGITQQFASVNAQIDVVSARVQHELPSSASGQTDASLLGTLRTQQSHLSVELDSINNQISAAQASGSVVLGSVSVMQQAKSAAGHSFVHLTQWCGFGLLVGVLLGIIGALVRVDRDPRLYTRRELAAGADAPVLASLQTTSCKTVADWHHLIGEYQPRDADAVSMRHLLDALGVRQDAHLSVRVVSFGADHAALAAGPQLAVFAASSGVRTALRPDASPAASLLRAACTMVGPQARPACLATGSAADTWHATDAELTISCCTVDTANFELPRSSSLTILSVSAGFATAEDLARLVLAAYDADEPIRGLVAVNPDPRDPTSGAEPGIKLVPRATWRPSVLEPSDRNWLGSNAEYPVRAREGTL